MRKLTKGTIRLDNSLKTEIQSFVYFLFSGALFNSKNIERSNYLDTLLQSPELLYNCFEVFAFSMQKPNSLPATGEVVEYIESILENNPIDISSAKHSNHLSRSFWVDFLDLAHKFCFNELSEKGVEIDLNSLNGCGTDAVPIFAVWSNLIELNDKCQLTNSNYVMNRLIQRFGINEMNEDSPEFNDWETEQEIY